MNKNSEFAQQVKEYRQTGDERIKKGLPLATISALLTGEKDAEKYPKPGTGYRVAEQVKECTGWIALDIDAKDNVHLPNAEAVRDAIANIVFVAYSGLSVSGKGVWALVKVEDPQKQPKYFEQLKKDFRKRGIILDSTKGKNPNDARFYSYDPDAYITDDFKVYDRLPKKQPTPIRKPAHSFNSSYSLDDTRSKVESLISKIQCQRIDITEGYQEWLDLGFALEDEFGEHGREYFHAISEFYPGYDKRECDRQYSHCLKHRGSGISIGTFFHRCREYGITLSREGGRDNGSQSKHEAENSAPHGYNPYTGEIFDKRGYPTEWDDIVLTESLDHKPITEAQLN